MKYYFDISTSARWSGHAVGIVRVERELARRGAAHLGDALGFCVYHRDTNTFCEISCGDAAEVLAGKLEISFEGKYSADAAGREQARAWARRQVMRAPRLYQAFQRLRGRSYSLEQIGVFRNEAFRDQVVTNSGVRRKSLAALGAQKLALDGETTIISGGLDWEFKDIRAIVDLKAEHGFRYVVIVYDLIPLLFPHFVVPAYVGLLTEYFGELMWLADFCVCISEATRRDLRAHCERYGLPSPASVAVPLGSDLPVQTDSDESDMPEALTGMSYALFVSTIEPRKNHRTLYRAWEYALQHGLIDPARRRIVFAGRVGWSMDDFLREIRDNPITSETILVLASVSDTLLSELYANAAFAVFPSYYEGYGLPLAEALAHGKACIASDAGSLSEIGGDLIVHVDPRDVIGWAHEMGRFFSDDVERTRREARIRNEYEVVTWDKSAALFYDALSSARS